MADIKAALNAQSAALALKAQQVAASSAASQNEIAKEQLKTLAAQNKIHIDTEDAVKSSENSLKKLLLLVEQFVHRAGDKAESIASLSGNKQAAAMAKSGSMEAKAKLTHLKTLGSMVKLIAKTVMNEKGDKTKIIDAKSALKVKEVKGKDKGIDSVLIANTMAASLAKTLNPIEFVKAFFSKLLPVLLILGILIYGFVTGFLDGTVADFIGTMVGVIIGAVFAYLGYMLVRELVAIGFKMACEMLKVAIEAAADWAAVGVIIAMVAVIGIAFLLAAALIIVIIGAALVGIVVAVWLVTKAITSLIEDMTENIMEIMGEQFEKLGGMITSVVETFTTLVPYMTETMVKMADDLKGGIEKALSGLVITFKLMTTVMEHLASEISSIFNGLAAAIISSTLGRTLKEKEAADVTINELNAQFKTEDKMWTMLGDKLKDLYGLGIARIIALTDSVANSIKAITNTFIGILLSMPILGMLYGLVGQNSFRDAIQPLLDTTIMIKDLITEVIKSAEGMKTGVIRTSAINNSEVNGNEYFNTAYNNTSYAYPTDAKRVFADTQELSAAFNKQSNYNDITKDFLRDELATINKTLKQIHAKLGTEKKGLFDGWFG